MKNQINKSVKSLLFITFILFSNYLSSAEQSTKINNENNDAILLDDYVKSKGAAIVFDAKSIKQFWIDKSVISRNNNIEVLLNSRTNDGFEGIPLKVQLANVNETMDCKVEVITNSSDASFTVKNNDLKNISASTSEDDFVQYGVLSSVFHMEDSSDDSFYLTFSSKSTETLVIKKILLSFSQNKESSFLLSPGTLSNLKEDFVIKAESSNINGNTISITGKSCEAVSRKFIVCPKKDVSFYAKIKNIGNSPLSVRVGFDTYSKNQKGVRGNYYTLNNNNEILNVISIEENGNKIVVDKEFQGGKGNPLVLNPKEDFSDIPNYSIIGYVDGIETIDDGHVAITLNPENKYLVDPASKNKIVPGAKLRAHSNIGMTLYLAAKTIKPGEELIINSTLKQDNNAILYTGSAFPRGIYSFKPTIRFSTGEETGTILISDCSISY